MSGPWLTVVGIGEDGRAGLATTALEALDRAELVVGGRRHLALAGPLRAPSQSWQSPLGATLERIAEWRGRRCVVLASGDPSWFGIAKLLRERFGAGAVAVLPTPSAFSLAAARLGWSLEDCIGLSAHGRPVAALRRHLQRGRRLLVLTDGGEAPGLIGELLGGAGFPDAEVTVLERLGGDAERVSRCRADAIAGPFAELNLVAVDLRPCAATGWPLVPGLADAAYEHDGQLTKSEVRAVALARLAPLPGERLWDVGAGSGSVAIEWLRAESGTTAIAVERLPERSRRIRANAARLGVPELAVVEGTAPACLAGLPTPDAVFVGGGCRDEALLESCWVALRMGGRLVAHAVTLEGERALLAFQARHGGELCRISLAHAEPVGRLTGWRPTLPVTQLVARR
jgi:precorrin-6Y C5,15-methyltransferase (decarboxylating)